MNWPLVICMVLGMVLAYVFGYFHCCWYLGQKGDDDGEIQTR